jgi:DNA-binding PadR family transcriptional regulator
MIRGHLKVFTLKALESQPSSGYSIMKFLEDKLGTKPSPGSMYPLLEELMSSKLVTCKEEGRKKVYSLTQEGKNKLKELDSQKDTLMKQMEEGFKMMAEMTGENTAFFSQIIEAIKKGEMPFKEVNPELLAFRQEIFRLFTQNKISEKRKEIRQILKKTINALRALT